MLPTLKINIIADYFIERNNKEKKGLTNKKLQKLLYYSQAWNLVFRNEPLFRDKIEAWIHGPAIPSVYVEYKDFGYNDIQKKIDTSNFSKLTKDEISLLEAVWKIYGKYDADYLEILSHSESPWIEARKNIPPYLSSNLVISLESMKKYYGEKLKKTQS